MKQYPFRLNAIAALFALGAWPAAHALAAGAEAETQTASLPIADVVVVSANATGASYFPAKFATGTYNSRLYWQAIGRWF